MSKIALCLGGLSLMVTCAAAYGIPQPSIAELARSADIVCRGTVVKISEVKLATSVGYQIITFEVAGVYKATEQLDTMSTVEVDGNIRQGKFLNLVVLTDTYLSERILPEYKLQRDYLLFINRVTQFLYSRTARDDRTGEIPFTPEAEQTLMKALNLRPTTTQVSPGSEVNPRG